MVLLAFGVSRSGFSLRVQAQCFVHGRQNLEEVGHLYLHGFHPVVKVCNLLLELEGRGVQCGYTVPALCCVHGGGAIESWGIGYLLRCLAEAGSAVEGLGWTRVMEGPTEHN